MLKDNDFHNNMRVTQALQLKKTLKWANFKPAERTIKPTWKQQTGIMIQFFTNETPKNKNKTKN